MLEMLKARRASLQEQGKKGFTLMEMLIVIAIIAILIAIAIPIFTQQLDRANAGTDESNIRSGFAQVQSDIMLNGIENATSPVTYTLMEDGTVTRDDGSKFGLDASKVPALTARDGVSAYQAKGNSTALATDGNVDISGISSSWSATNLIHIVYTPATTSGGTTTSASYAINGVANQQTQP